MVWHRLGKAAGAIPYRFKSCTLRQKLVTKFIKIGHRGAMGYEPENTPRSFNKAIELGVDMLEFDVHLCKTGEAVEIHDGSGGKNNKSPRFFLHI